MDQLFDKTTSIFGLAFDLKAFMNGTIEKFCLAWHHLSFGTWIDDNIDNCDHFCYKQNPI